MIYSVFDHNRGVYDYYEGAGPGGTHAGSPALSPTRSQDVGKAPVHAAWRLPPGAKRVGSGEFPQGSIASLSGVDSASGGIPFLGYAAIAYLAWRFLR